jgi:signal transduction histidine kinase
MEEISKISKEALKGLKDLTNKDKVQLLKSSVHKISNPAFLVEIRPKNPNYLEIIECNKDFLKCFDISLQEVIGNNYDFLLTNNSLDYESEEYFRYSNLIKAVKNLKAADLKIDIPHPKNKTIVNEFNIKFIPSRYKTNHIYCTFIFEKNLAVKKSKKNKEEEDKESRSLALVHNVERALRNERLIRSLVDIIASSDDLVESANEIVKSLCQYLKVDRCILHNIDNNKIGFVVESCGTDMKKISESKDVDSNNKKPLIRYINCQKHIFDDINRLKKSNSVLVYENMDSSQFASIKDICHDYKIGSQMIVSMSINNNTNGSLYIIQSASRQWLLEEIELVEILAYQFAMAIDRISNLDKLKASLEEEKRMRKIQAEFVAMVSHEFKTPLQIIDGARELVSRKLKTLTTDEDFITKSLDRIKSGIVRMNNLIQSTLSLSKIELTDGGIKANRQIFEIKNLIKDIIDKNSNLAEEKHIKIEVDIEKLPDEFNGDQKLLDHCFTNVITNAVKYSKASSVIKVIGDIKEQSVMLKVIDSGIGIPKEDIKQIGNKFFRAQNTLSVAGTGIGLYLTKYFIELHGGSVLIKSELNVGTIITILLPIK